ASNYPSQFHKMYLLLFIPRNGHKDLASSHHRIFRQLNKCHRTLFSPRSDQVRTPEETLAPTILGF
ncbi:hypothetical protein A2U01_0100747, partial [Trifolium medium]|nr:hypothetical protein [Trifolium medium]